LINALKAWEGQGAGTLIVLKPLIISDKQELIEATPRWRSEIKALKLPEHREKTLLELLIYSILERFPGLTKEEAQNMLQLTPLDQTVIGKELIQRGRREGIAEGKAEGKREGMEKGKLIGEIQMAQRMLKQSLVSDKELSKKSVKELRAILQQLESQIESA
jgi:predicted transposase YdaD